MDGRRQLEPVVDGVLDETVVRHMPPPLILDPGSGGVGAAGVESTRSDFC